MHYPSLIAITAAAASLALPSKVTAQSVPNLAMRLGVDQPAKLATYNLKSAALAPRQESSAQSASGPGKVEQANPANKWLPASLETSEDTAQGLPDESLRIAPEQRTKSAAYKWEAAFLALSAIDGIETISCLNRDKCTEHNPIWGHHPSTGKVVAAKLGLGLIHLGVFKLIADRDPHTALRAAQVSAAVQGGVVLLNLHTAF